MIEMLISLIVVVISHRIHISKHQLVYLKYIKLLCVNYTSVKLKKNFFYKFILFIYFWLHWVFFAGCGLSLVVASGGYTLLRCMGFSLWWLLLLHSMGCRCVGSVVVAHGLQSAGSVVVAHGLSSSMACGIFPDQGSNPCPLHWQVDSFFFFLINLLFLQWQREGATLHCGARASNCSGFSCCGAQALGAWASVVMARRLSSCGMRALECRLSSCGTQAQLLCGMWDLPRPGLEPMSPALAGGFLTTAPPGKPWQVNS